MEIKKTWEYKVGRSSERIDNILNQTDAVFEELSEIPNKTKLTHENGYYVNVGALFVDIRDSSKLTESHKRPHLAKLYRAYISEVSAIVYSYDRCKHINIVGDCVSAIFNGSKTSVCKDITEASGKINTLMEIINYKYKKRGIIPIKIGIGLDYGRALMIKAGYKGTGIDEIVWMGDVVNKAAKLCNMANKNDREPILLTEAVYETVTWKNKNSVMDKTNINGIYQGNFVNPDMYDWFDENCK